VARVPGRDFRATWERLPGAHLQTRGLWEGPSSATVGGKTRGRWI